MTPTPLTNCLPKLAAEIDSNRPLISATLLDVDVTAIEDDKVHAAVRNQHSLAILTSTGQRDYLNDVLTRHFGRPATFDFHLSPESELPLANDHRSPVTDDRPASKKRTANTLCWTDREKLAAWMRQDDNRDFVALRPDTAAAAKASDDLGIAITSGNIAGMRRALDITKTSPERPAPPATDIDLVALYGRLDNFEARFEAQAISARSMNELITSLRDTMDTLTARVVSLEASND